MKNSHIDTKLSKLITGLENRIYIGSAHDSTEEELQHSVKNISSQGKDCKGDQEDRRGSVEKIHEYGNRWTVGIYLSCLERPLGEIKHCEKNILLDEVGVKVLEKSDEREHNKIQLLMRHS
jgi:hypothetical protein